MCKYWHLTTSFMVKSQLQKGFILWNLREIILQGFLRSICSSLPTETRISGFSFIKFISSIIYFFSFFVMMIEQTSQLSFLHYQYKCNQIWMLLALLYKRRKEFWIKYAVSSKFIICFSTAYVQSILQNAVVKEMLSEVNQMHVCLQICPSYEV